MRPVLLSPQSSLLITFLAHISHQIEVDLAGLEQPAVLLLHKLRFITLTEHITHFDFFSGSSISVLPPV